MSSARRSRAKMLEETREKLISTARVAFATQGFLNTSMEDFTAKIGLTRGAVYHHFGNKEGLFIAVIEQIEAEVNETLKEVSKSASTPWESFHLCCNTYLKLSLEPDIRRIILQDARSIFGDVPRASQELSVAALQSSLDIMIAGGVITDLPSNVLARMIYGAITEASFWIAEQDADYELHLSQALKGLESLLKGLLIRN